MHAETFLAVGLAHGSDQVWSGRTRWGRPGESGIVFICRNLTQPSGLVTKITRMCLPTQM
jgi:hypothetical protein